MNHRLISIAAIVALLCASAVFGQGWPLAASADGPCNSVCPDPSKKIIGFGDVFAGFTGRYLDSTQMVDLQQPYRTARARHIRFSPDRKRIYPWIGEGVGVYDANTFFTRLEAREKLVPVTTIPLSGNLWSLMPRPGRAEEFLRWDQYFYAENGSPWRTGVVDGQQRLSDIDTDDQGYVYIAYSVFGWGIVKDGRVADGSMMSSAVQNADVSDGDFNSIVAIKASTGYYALTRQARTNLWKLTSQRTIDGSPTPFPFNFDGAAKTADMSRVALLVVGQVRIYAPDDLVQGRGPLQTFATSLGTGGGGYGAVASDGTKFYAVAGTTAGVVLAVFSPNSSGGYTQQEFQTGVLFSPLSLQATDSYVVMGGFGGYPFGPYDVGLFKMVGGSPQHIEFNRYFPNYYTVPPAGYAAPHPGAININEAAVIRNDSSGKTYLIVCGHDLGDVYELKDPGSVSLDPPAAIGSPNSRRPTDAGLGPFYGDLLRFTARSAAPALTWSFGDGLGTSSTPAPAGTFVQDHKFGNNLAYSGPAGGVGDPLPKTFATTAASTTSTATTTFLMQRPVPRFGVTGYRYLFKQPDASSTAPIVLGDTFFDASDGDIDGHYDVWSIDNVANKLMPSATTSTGDCGTHLLDFEGHYGANAPLLTVMPDYVTAIRGFRYGVTPFAASIDYAAGTTGVVTFTAFPRTTTNTSILSAAQVSQLTYAWSLVNAQGVPVPTSPPGPSGTGIVSIPSWTLDKSYFAVGGNRVQLVLTSPTAPTGSCAGITRYTAATPPLNLPDPRVDPANCPGGGPLCTLTVLSQRANFDQAADHWQYSWSVDSTNYSAPSLTGQIFTPTFTKVWPSYTVTVTVTNDIGSKSVSQIIDIRNAPPPCAPIVDGVNLFVNYNGPGPCGLGFSNCNAGQDVTFQVQKSAFSNYDLSCSTHNAHWDFGDAQFGDGMSFTHRFGSSGSYQVKAFVSNGAQTNVQLNATVTIGTVYQPPPDTGGCPTIQPDLNMLISYLGPTSGCSRGGKACGSGEAVAFQVATWQYSLACGSHVFLWSFTDGSGAQPFGQYVSHSFPNAGTFTATVGVSVNGRSPVSISVPVVVSGSSGGGTTPTTCPAMNAADPFVTYSGPVSHCAVGTPCQTSETIQFDINTFQYPIACGTHEFTWDFNDGGAKPVGKSVTHVFTKTGIFKGTISVKIDGTAIATTIPVNVTIEGGARRRGSRH